MIKDNLKKVLDSITNIAEKYNIKHFIKLVAVSKYSDINAINEAFKAGQIDFGENKVQDLVMKYEAFKDLDSKNVLHLKETHIIKSPINWHFLGHLQENKINSLLKLDISLFHSLHSLELAYALQKRLEKQNKHLKALLQVNSANETSKQGFAPSKLLESYLEIKETCPNIILNGLMCIGANTDNITLIDKSFNITKNLFDKIPDKTNDSILSMGMSSDYEIALKNGSNCLRIGSQIFKLISN